VFFKAQQKPGWLSLAASGGRIDLVHVSRAAAGLPAVTLYETCRHEGLPEHTLTRLRRERQLDGFRLTSVLPAGQYQWLQLDAPAVPDAELASALRWRVRDLVDYPVEAAVVETLSIPLDPSSASRTHQVFAVVAHEQALYRHAELLAHSGFRLEAIDIHEVAQRNISALFESAGRGIAVLAFDGDRGGLLTVTFGGELCLARRIDASLAALAEAPADTRQSVHDRITVELQRSIDHFDRQFSFVNVSKLLVAGEDPVEGLRDCLAQNLDLPVEILDLGPVMDFTAVPALRAPARQAACLTGIGAALRAVAPGRLG